MYKTYVLYLVKLLGCKWKVFQIMAIFQIFIACYIPISDVSENHLLHIFAKFALSISDFSCSGGHTMWFPCDFNYISLIMSNFEHPFMYFWPFAYLEHLKYLFRCFANLQNWVLEECFIYIWIQALVCCVICVCYIISNICTTVLNSSKMYQV